jgi:endonuclease/exonuclease/phosphatase family metal-dependent hydrolase
LKKKFRIAIFLLILIAVVFVSVYAYFKIKEMKNQTVEVAVTPEKLKVMSFNINHGEGSDGGYGLKEIIQIIRSENPDIVTLNDVDKLAVRTYREDQARKIAGNLGMNFTYGETSEIEGGWNGNAILSKYPLIYSGNRFFSAGAKENPKAYLHTTYALGDLKVHIITTEFSEGEETAVKQKQEMLDRVLNDMTKFIVNDPIILTGTFNMNHNHSAIKDLDNYFINTTRKNSNKLTYPARNPVRQGDYIFYRKNIKLLSAEIVDNNNTRNSSDHLPLWAEFLLR